MLLTGWGRCDGASVHADESPRGFSSDGRPVAHDTNVEMYQGGRIELNLSASDPDGDPLTYNILSRPASGMLSGNPPRLFYTPEEEFAGEIRLSFDASDGTSSSRPAMVRITVKPILSAFPFITRPDQRSVYFVSPDGRPNNAGSSGAPLELAKALARARPGDIVILRGGYYDVSLRPRHSGTPGNYIYFLNYPGEEPVITGPTPAQEGFTCFLVSRRSYIWIHGLGCKGLRKEGPDNTHSTVSWWASFSGDSNYNVLEHCQLSNARRHGIDVFGGAYNRFSHNRLTFVGSPVTGSGEAFRIGGGHHNLFEHNAVSHAGHNLTLFKDGAAYNIIRNNDLRNPWWRVGVGMGSTSRPNLVEGNRIHEAAREQGRTVGRTVPAWKIWSPGSIYRRNLFYGNRRVGLKITPKIPEVSDVTGNRIYHNVFYGNGAEGFLFKDKGDAGLLTEGNILINNIFHNNSVAEPGGADVAYDSAHGVRDVALIHNEISSGGSGEGRLQLAEAAPVTKLYTHFQASLPKRVSGNMNLGPKFTNPDAGDFTLTEDSPLIDKGAFLTRTATAGSGASIEVLDAGFFVDGFGIADGDVIQLEGTDRALEVLSVDYSRNRVTVKPPTSWREGQGLALEFSGSAPDPGAFER
jgi:parallel beta-helix repeat protein